MIADRRGRGKTPKGFRIWRDTKSPYRWRCEHRASKIKIDCVKFEPWSPEWYGECLRVLALVEKANLTKPGSLGLLISRYRADVAFTDLAQRTMSDYQKIFNYLQPIADTPLVKFDTPLIVRIRDKAAEKHGRRFGNYVRSVLSLLFEWGRERGYVKINPAFRIRSIKRPKDAPRANRPWRGAELQAVLDALPAHMRLPITLMMYCGLDPQDTLRLPKNAIADGMIDTKRGKTGAGSPLPLPKPVADAIKAQQPHDAITLCANSRGKPWTVSGFRASWRPIRVSLEQSGAVQPGLTLKGLRHTVATLLAELGYDDRTIADMLQQKTTAMARHYSRDADRSRKLSSVTIDLAEELNRRRTKIVKP